MNYRYPGPQSFREEDELLFHGRKKEAKALHDLVMAQPLVALFSKSGMGKTSLLQAGLAPRLRFSPFDLVKIRLNRTADPLEEQAIGALLPGMPPGSLLWEAVGCYNRERRGTPLLVFDQFEEVFTLYSPERRAEFVRQLADVANQFLPEKIRQAIRQKLAAGTLTDAEAAELEAPPKVKIVLSIRSDLLHCLHDLSDEIPSILRNRFELLGLAPEQARDAIELPAAEPREVGDFASPSFRWSAAAVGQVLDFLSKKRQAAPFDGPSQTGKEVETFQLQLVCEHVERRVLEMGDSAKSNLVVTPDFYGGEAGIEAILGSFYEMTLSQIADEQERERARRLVEDHLVVSGRRVAVDEATIEQAHGVAPATLALLADARLLRRDVRETGNYFELAHDTLLPPILRSREVWEKAEAERISREAEKKAQAEERKRRKAVMIAIVSGGLAVVAIAASAAAFFQYKKAERARLEVFRNALDAQRNLAERLKVDGQYDEAIGLLWKISAQAGTDAALRDSTDRRRDEWQKVAAHVKAGESLYERGSLREAVIELEAAQIISPDQRVASMVGVAARELEARFADLCNNAVLQARVGQTGLAIGNYEAALRLKPGDTAVEARLRALKR